MWQHRHDPRPKCECFNPLSRGCVIPGQQGAGTPSKINFLLFMRKHGPFHECTAQDQRGKARCAVGRRERGRVKREWELSLCALRKHCTVFQRKSLRGLKDIKAICPTEILNILNAGCLTFSSPLFSFLFLFELQPCNLPELKVLSSWQGKMTFFYIGHGVLLE